MRSSRHRQSIISLLLLVLVARALVPAGFMPASNGSAQLMLCPAGMLMPAVSTQGDPAAPGQPHTHTDSCPYGSAPFAAPLAHLPVIPTLVPAISTPGFEPVLWRAGSRPDRTQQPRAPPA